MYLLFVGTYNHQTQISEFAMDPVLQRVKYYWHVIITEYDTNKETIRHAQPRRDDQC